MQFTNRTEAGKLLAGKLEEYKKKDVIVYALPRGGVVTALQVAKYLHAPLDLIITRKIGSPHSSEYAIGAIAENGHSVFNKEEVVTIDEDYIAQESRKQKIEARRRREIYMGDRMPISCKGKIAIIVDDGIATGLTMKTAIAELQIHHKPREIIVAVPVAPMENIEELENMGVNVVTILEERVFLGAIGSYYQDFSEVKDEEVIMILKNYNMKGI